MADDYIGTLLRREVELRARVQELERAQAEDEQRARRDSTRIEDLEREWQAQAQHSEELERENQTLAEGRVADLKRAVEIEDALRAKVQELEREVAGYQQSYVKALDVCKAREDQIAELEREVAAERQAALNDPAEQRAERYALEAADLTRRLMELEREVAALKVAANDLLGLAHLDEAYVLQHHAPCKFWKSIKEKGCDCPIGAAVLRLRKQAS